MSRSHVTADLRPVNNGELAECYTTVNLSNRLCAIPFAEDPSQTCKCQGPQMYVCKMRTRFLVYAYRACYPLPRGLPWFAKITPSSSDRNTFAFRPSLSSVINNETSFVGFGSTNHNENKHHRLWTLYEQLIGDQARPWEGKETKVKPYPID